LDKTVYTAVPPEPPCPTCGKSPCACAASRPRQPDPVYLRLDRSGRGGKTVTLVEGLRMHPAGKEELLRRFQKLCGAGGTLKEGRLELQGDQRAKLKTELERTGYRVKTP
jgi:translation initiation factor 1